MPIVPLQARKVLNFSILRRANSPHQYILKLIRSKCSDRIRLQQGNVTIDYKSVVIGKGKPAIEIKYIFTLIGYASFHTRNFHTLTFIPGFSYPDFFIPSFFIPSFFIPTLSYPNFSYPSFFIPRFFIPTLSYPDFHTQVFSYPGFFIPSFFIPKFFIFSLSYPIFHTPVFSYHLSSTALTHGHS